MAEPFARLAKTAGGALLSSAIVASAMMLIQNFEGTRLAPYRDIVGVWTVCMGETHVPMRRYSHAECEAMLRVAVTSDYGQGVLHAVPGLADRPGPLVASISLAYNIGVPRFAQSTVAQRFRAGDWRGGCDAFRHWVYAGGTRYPGLVRRREAERTVCLKGMQ